MIKLKFSLQAKQQKRNKTEQPSNSQASLSESAITYMGVFFVLQVFLTIFGLEFNLVLLNICHRKSSYSYVPSAAKLLSPKNPHKYKTRKAKRYNVLFVTFALIEKLALSFHHVRGPRALTGRLEILFSAGKK